MPALSNTVILGSKLEAVPGTKETLVAADFKHDPRRDISLTAEVQETERKTATGEFGNSPSVFGRQSATLGFNEDLKSSGVLGTPSTLSDLFQACGMVETVNGVIDVSYVTDRNANCNTLTLERRIFDCTPATDIQTLENVFGAVGTFVMSASEVGEPLLLAFEFQGKYTSSADTTTIIEQTGADTTLPPAFLGATITYNAKTFDVQSFEFDLANDIQACMDAADATGIKNFYIADRTPVANLVFKRPLTADYDYYADWIVGTEAAFSLTVGTSLNQWVLTFNAQIKSAPTEDAEGQMNVNASLQVVGQVTLTQQ